MSNEREKCEACYALVSLENSVQELKVIIDAIKSDLSDFKIEMKDEVSALRLNLHDIKILFLKANGFNERLCSLEKKMEQSRTNALTKKDLALLITGISLSLSFIAVLLKIIGVNI